MSKIFPSLIASDLLNLGTTIKELDPLCAGYHIDIMDNHFVPNLTWGTMFANAIDQATPHPSWVHFMVDNPKILISRLNTKANSIITIHIEHIDKDGDIIKFIREKKLRPSVALSPKLPVEKILPLIGKDIDHVLIMSVEPGFSGQVFMPDVISKVKALAEYRTKKSINLTISMDGGINETNIQQLIKAGVDEFAVAAGVFKQKQPKKALAALIELSK